MKTSKTFILASSTFMTASVLLIGAGITKFVPDSVMGKQLMTGLLFSLSPVPLAAAVYTVQTLRSYAGAARQLATRDPLTNLYNQTTFWDLLNYETDRSRRQGYRFSLLLIDLDNFKAVNDRYGHETGDAFLVEFAGLLKSSIRKGDIAARYGGDNFVTILPVCDEAQAHQVCQRLLESMRIYNHPLPDGSTVRITASIGIGVFPDHAQDGMNLYLLADNMLLQAKTGGKDRYRVPSEQVDLNELRSAGEKSILIMEALRAKRIIPYFQPIISVREQTVLAYEVLTRIVTPERVIPAAEFIEEAEGMGAIGKIDSILVERAFALAKRENFTGQLFFNLSPKALTSADFIPTIRKLLRDYGIENSQIVFEITERDTVKNLDALQLQVRKLKNEGFRFAIDDFGSGYSSFRSIKLFSVDFLKVDGEFIRSMAGSHNRIEKAIVTNIAALAGSLGIKTIAEYVESESILGNVLTAGIDFAQGYYIQRPSPTLALRPAAGLASSIPPV